MGVRAKLVVTELKQPHEGSRNVRLECRYDESIPEDQRFYKATPMGIFEMLIDNPEAIKQLELGKAFYVTLEPVPQGE